MGMDCKYNFYYAFADFGHVACDAAQAARCFYYLVLLHQLSSFLAFYVEFQIFSIIPCTWLVCKHETQSDVLF